MPLAVSSTEVYGLPASVMVYLAADDSNWGASISVPSDPPPEVSPLSSPLLPSSSLHDAIANAANTAKAMYMALPITVFSISLFINNLILMLPIVCNLNI